MLYVLYQYVFYLLTLLLITRARNSFPKKNETVLFVCSAAYLMTLIHQNDIALDDRMILVDE
jgi:hypothetical protein